MKPLEWLSNLLKRHGIPKPDGRPLYQYRVTDDEFVSLQCVLRDACLAGINSAVKTGFFDLAFVIYGAEWWRRHYEGQWGWEGIFSSFGADVLPPNQRSILVETGLRRWKKSVRTTNHYRNFLGSVAIEGGLPLYQLVSDSGWLPPTLNQVTKRYVELGEDRFEASYVVSQYAHYLPQTYRRDEVYEILGDMVSAVVSLKRDHDLAGKRDPIEWLNAHLAEWKDQFPLPVDDEVGGAVLVDMVRTAIASKADDKTVVFQGIRYLSGISTEEPTLNFQFEAQPFYPLRGLFTEDETSNLPHRLQIDLFSDSGKSWRFADAYRVQWKGLPALKINNLMIRLKCEDVVDGLRIRFQHLGQTIKEADIGAESLDRDVPWVFAEKGDRWQLVGQASQKLRADIAVVWVPNKLVLLYPNGGIPRSIGEFEGGRFLRVEKDLVLTASDARYSIRVNQQEETPVEYVLSGRRLSHPCKPVDCYIGRPKVIGVNRITGHRNTVPTNRVRTRAVVAGDGWQTLSEVLPGVHDLQILDGDEIVYRKRVGILPEGTRVSYFPGASPREGVISIEQLANWQAACPDEPVRTSISTEDGLKVGLSTIGLPPSEVTLELWRDTLSQPIRVRLPYPSGGVICLAPNDKQLSTSAELFLGALHGYRIRFFARRTGKPHISIRLTLIDPGLADARDLYVELGRYLSEGAAELPLVDFLTDIRGLLAISANLDAYVKLSVFYGGSEWPSLKIRRFRMDVVPDRTSGEVRLEATSDMSFEELKSLRFEAMRLSQPDQAAVQLEAVTSQGMEIGVWRFTPESRAAGPWLIYSGADSTSVLVRPLLWKVGDQAAPAVVRSLHAAVCIDDPEERSTTLQRLLSEMAVDSSHSGWEYLRALGAHFKHLPFSTFQVWKESIANSKLLAAMAVHLNEALLDRLEEELPVMWELITIHEWVQVLQPYQETLLDAVDDEEIVRNIIDDAIDRIGKLNDVMGTVAKVIRHRVLNEAAQDLQLMQGPGAGAMLAPMVASQRQLLLQRQAESDWPTLLKSEVSGAWRDVPESLSALIQGEQDYRATIVYLPIILVHRLFQEPTVTMDSLHVFKYRRLKLFDEDWYSAAFNYACGYWSQQG